MRRYLARGFGLIAAGLSAFLLIGLWLPGSWLAESSIEIAADPAVVFVFLEDLSRWEEWTPWGDIESDVTDPPFGVGAARVWDDEQLGSGSVTVIESRPPDLLRYRVEMGGRERIIGEIEVVAVAEGSLVRWREAGDFGWNPLMGYIARGMGESQGKQLAASLTRLKQVSAAVDSISKERTSGPG